MALIRNKSYRGTRGMATGKSKFANTMLLNRILIVLKEGPMCKTDIARKCLNMDIRYIDSALLFLLKHKLIISKYLEQTKENKKRFGRWVGTSKTYKLNPNLNLL